jgi:hypothetical protein
VLARTAGDVMSSNDHRVLLRRFKGDADAVVFHHIFNQDKLDEDDRSFLEEHLGALGFATVVLWLAREPEHPRQRKRIDRLVEVWPRENAAGGEARDLVELNLRLLKRSKTRDAQPSDILGAVMLLTEPLAA